jgi:23S rRNA (adenine1618-N6)-methyltransferase
MPSKPKSVIDEKLELHPRNKHRGRYQFAVLIKKCPDLADFVIKNEFADETIDFTDSLAVKTLNKALLIYFYGIQLWDIPEGFLCPPIPGRADYLHYVADLIADNNGIIP